MITEIEIVEFHLHQEF